jgi:hypothetical protein
MKKTTKAPAEAPSDEEVLYAHIAQDVHKAVHLRTLGTVRDLRVIVSEDEVVLEGRTFVEPDDLMLVLDAAFAHCEGFNVQNNIKLVA